MDSHARERSDDKQDVQVPDHRVGVRIPQDRIDGIWREVEPMLSAALEHGSGEYRIEDVRRLLVNGDWQLWSDGRSVACTQITLFPARRVLYVILGAGELSGVANMWGVVQGYAKAVGCQAVQFFARPGWKRSHVLPGGVKHTHDVFTVEV